MADVTLSFPQPASRRRRAGKRTAKRIVLYVIAGVVLAVILVPLAYAWLGGFRDNQQLVTKPAGLPDPWVLDNYRGVLGSSAFWRQLSERRRSESQTRCAARWARCCSEWASADRALRSTSRCRECCGMPCPRRRPNLR